MRLIDADKLKKSIRLSTLHLSDLWKRVVGDIIDNQDIIEFSQWIPCSERLPWKHRDVFQVTIIRLQDNYKWVQSMLWNCDEWKWWEEDEKEIDVENYKVIAWKLLPQPYKGE